MNPGGREPAPASGLTGSPLEQQAPKLKPNRLSRSLRPNQTAAEVGSPQSQRSDFKTPTRIPRSRLVGGFAGESPHNDSDFQQDIIWDATSPSPRRLGRKGRKHPTGVVNISEIVSRIAPKHGRPQVAEPTLQQWIGDSATIPCTPDVRVPKPKRKSPRPNAVDDLLRLAKQFDFNMFHQGEEEEVEDLHQLSQELLSEDILDFGMGQDDFVPSPHGNHQPASNTVAGTNAPLHPDQHAEDDLDFLFDGPTQDVSGNLSQVSSARPLVRPALASSSKEAPGKPPANGGAVNHEFEDDWENDDLLNDSLVLEMTQNPLSFTAPKHCSTQKPAGDLQDRGSVRVPACGDIGLGQLVVSRAERENVKQRATFKLESNPNLSVKRVQTDTRTNPKVDYCSKTAGEDTQPSFFSYGKGPSVETGSQCPWQTSNTLKSDQQSSRFYQRTLVSSSSSAPSVSITTATKTTLSFPTEPDVVSSHIEPAAVSDLLDEDLDSFFSSEPFWDDPADDDLLWEMGEDLENQIQSMENMSAKQTPLISQTSGQRAALQPPNRTSDDRNQQTANQKRAPTTLPGGSGRAAGISPAGVCASDVTAGIQVKTVKDSLRYTQTKTASGSTSSSTCLQRNPPKDQFSFRRSNHPVSTGTYKVLAKCSAAEIELKKQQAMERRRRRLEADRNLRAKT